MKIHVKIINSQNIPDVKWWGREMELRGEMKLHVWEKSFRKY